MPEPLHPTLRSRLPVVLVMLLLSTLIIVPIVTQRRIAKLRADIAEVAEPARHQLTAVLFARARETSVTRSFLLTGDPAWIAAREVPQRDLARSYNALRPLAQKLGPDVYAQVLQLGQLLRASQSRPDSLFSGQLTRAQYLQHLPAQEQQLAQLEATAAGISDQISRKLVSTSDTIADVERAGAIIIIILGLLSILTALLVARLARSYRLLAGRLQRRGRWREAYSEAARELAAIDTMERATNLAVTRAIAITSATGAFIELTGLNDSSGHVEIASAAGSGVPAPHTRFPYATSLSRQVADSGKSLFLSGRTGTREDVPSYVRENCLDCSVLVLPLFANADVMGAFVLLRNAQPGPYPEDEVAFLDALSDLFVATIHRVRLLDELSEAELRFRQIADHLREVIWLGTPDLSRRFYVNPAYEQVFGQSAETFLATPGATLALVHPEDRARVENELKGLTFGTYNTTYRIIRPDGNVRWIWSRGYPIYDERGNVYRVAGIMEDVTHLKHIEHEREELLQSVRDARDRMVNLLESMQEAFYALDHEERFTYVNREAERMLRVSREDLLGHVVWDLYPDLVGSVLYNSYQRAMRDRIVVHFELYYEPLDTLFEVRAYPSADGLSVLFQDITERRRAEGEREELLKREQQARREAEDRRAELARVTESRATLMRGFGHDVKNPLGAADGYLQLLEEGILGALDEQQLTSVHKVRDSIHAALSLIEDVLAFARAEAGEIDIKLRPTNVPDVVREAADEYHAQAEAEGLTLIVDTDRDIPNIESDPRRIRQIIANLLSNAVKYTDHGGITISVHLREGGVAPGPGRWIAVDVRDTGPGIPEDQQEIIFHEFRRASAGTTEPGAGIGLAIARRIARALNGEISLRSQPGAGSTFTLWLPTT